jgi:KDO2-lipid IV(A) lauroyltransferase
VGTEEFIHPSELSGDSSDVKLITQRFTHALERIIRRDPDQYLWLHRRWKHQPKPKSTRKAIEPGVAA